MERERSPRGWARAAALGAGLLVLAAGAVPSGGAELLGPHDDGTGNPCRRCHDTASGNPVLRGWAGTPGSPGTIWAKGPSQLCYYCHDSTGTMGAHDMSANAYANTSHLFGVVVAPTKPDGRVEDAVITSGLPYTNTPAGELECTSCHNVHRETDRPFLHRPTIQELCTACHPERVNNDSATSYPGVVHGFETHPTRQTLVDTARANIKADTAIAANLKVETLPAPDYALGGHLADPGGATGVFDCQTCHAVHGPTLGVGGIDDLLAIDNTTAAPGGSALCEGCHYGGDAGEQVGSLVEQATLPAGDWSDHPIDALGNRPWYPTGVVIPNGAHVPVVWGPGNLHGDRGAQPLYPAALGDTPVCSSCHDVHGSLPGTPLLRGPSVDAAGLLTWAFSYDTWCFVCHLAAEAAPIGHHSVINNLAVAQGDPIDSQLACGDCHGAAANGTDWKAHNGFWSFAVAVAAGDSAICEGCHQPDNPLAVATDGLKGIPGSLVSPIATPASHGTPRGAASHYLGPDSDEFPGVSPKTDAWGSGFFSEYGPPNAAGGGAVAPAGPGEIICESCHNVIYNDGSANPGNYSTPEKAGWESNLLVEPYADDPPGAGAGAGANGVGSALCTGCHGAIGIHHPMTGDIVSLTGLALRTGAGSFADQTAAPVGGGSAPGTLSYPDSDALDCDSCHRPHAADDDSTVAAAQHGSSTSADGRPTRHILELDDPGHVFSPLCLECHAR